MNVLRDKVSTKSFFRQMWIRVGVLTSITVFLVMSTLWGGSAYARMFPKSSVALPGSINPQVAQAHLLGHHVDPRNTAASSITIGLVLYPNHREAMNTLTKALYNPHSPLYHHWLSTGKFDELYGPTATERDVIDSFLRQSGLRIVPDSSSALIIMATGSTSQVETAFHTRINDYKLSNGTTFFANGTALYVPYDLSKLVQGVLGLSNLSIARPLRTRTRMVTQRYGGGPRGTGLTPSQIAGIYHADNIYNTTRGKATTLGLFELAGYKASDISVYEKQFGLPSVPLQNVVVSTPGHDGAAEVELDIEMQIALAPDVKKIQVYEAKNNELDAANEYQRIASDNQSDSISTSWGLCEPDAPSSYVNAEAMAFQKMAMQGQSIFAASGDNGAYDCLSSPNNTTLQVDDPASQPYMTGTGGTTLSGFNPGNNPHPTYPTNQEVTWSGSGGGNSRLWTRPDYQKGPGVDESNYSQSGSWCGQSAGVACREVPDVSLNADPNTGYAIYCTDPGDSYCAQASGWFQIGGTSAAAPLWAAFTALNDSYHAKRAGLLNSALYSLNSSNAYNTAFHDIVQGDNGTGQPGYPAGPHYDMATGIGTPDMYQLVLALG